MIPVNIPDIREEDLQSVVNALREGWISGEGPIVREFENKVARLAGRQFGVAVSNGSDAIELALRVLELEAGSEVILPSFAIISCLAPILRLGLVPVFIDSTRDTWNIDTAQIEQMISNKTRAILVVHTYGLAADMDEIMRIASEHGLFVIEDAAEAHGLFYKGKPCGSFGDLSTFSFYANKNVTTGEGGAVVTDNENLFERLCYFRNLTFQADRRFVHEDLGWNMRLSSIQAAFGISQLERVTEAVAKRKEIANRYISELSTGDGWLRFQSSSHLGEENGYWVVGTVLSENHPKFSTAAEAMKALGEAGVGSRPFFFPLHQQPLLREFSFRKSNSLEIAPTLGRMGLYLPNGLGMDNDTLEASIKISKKVLLGA